MNILLQVKHQRAFHRLLLSLAIMDNLYLVNCNLILRMDFHFIFLFVKIASALTFSLANLSPSYDGHAWNYIVPYRSPPDQLEHTCNICMNIFIGMWMNIFMSSYTNIPTPIIALSVRWLLNNTVALPVWKNGK